MPEYKSCAVFISHAWSFHSDYDRLEMMLNEAPDFTWRNYSAPHVATPDTASSAELEIALVRQILPTHIVLILAGMYFHHQKWIQKEIDIALELEKPIVGILPWGPEQTPPEVRTFANEMVGWDTVMIVSAIKKYCL